MIPLEKPFCAHRVKSRFLFVTRSILPANGALVFAGPVVDAAGNGYVAGWFQNSAVFGTNTLTGRGYWDFFLSKMGSAPLPLALGIRWAGSRPRLSITGEIGIRFALEYAPALPATNNWQPLLTNTLATSPFIYTDASADGSRFYRARLVP